MAKGIKKMKRFKKLKKYAIFTIMYLLLTNCTKPKNNGHRKRLLLETKHCRYYCVDRERYNYCQALVCECDEGYSCDASVTR